MGVGACLWFWVALGAWWWFGGEGSAVALLGLLLAAGAGACVEQESFCLPYLLFDTLLWMAVGRSMRWTIHTQAKVVVERQILREQ